MPHCCLVAWLVNLYRGYLCICAGGEQQLSGVERHAEAAAAQCLREWRRLPRIVSHAHLPLLRAAQQLMELSEAAQIHTVRLFLPLPALVPLMRVSYDNFLSGPPPQSADLSSRHEGHSKNVAQ